MRHIDCVCASSVTKAGQPGQSFYDVTQRVASQKIEIGQTDWFETIIENKIDMIGGIKIAQDEIGVLSF